MTTCHNAEPGTYGHECGKPATWTASKPSKLSPGDLFHSTFCDECKEHGTEARQFSDWQSV